MGERNRINTEQNEEKILRYIFCMRKLYSQSKMLKYIAIIGGIIIYAYGKISYLKNLLGTVGIAISCIFPVISYLLEQYQMSKRQLAADFQQYIDLSLFKLEDDRGFWHKSGKLEEEAYIMIGANKKKYMKQLSATSKQPIRNWYGYVEEFSLEMASILCQYESICWGSKQRKEYQRVLYGILFIIIGIEFGICYLGEYELIYLLYVIPIGFELYKLIVDNGKAISWLERANENIIVLRREKQLGNKVSNSELRKYCSSIQENLYRYRRGCIPVPDFLYIFRRKAYYRMVCETIRLTKESLGEFYRK